MLARHALGRRAEEAVATWLTDAGWSVLARRWRRPGGELDLVCLDPGRVLVAVEVRARTSARAGTPIESVDRRRIGRMRATLSRYADEERPSHRGVRLDLVSVTPVDDGSWLLRRHPAIDAW